MIREATPADAAACAAVYAPYVTDSWISFEARPPSESEVRRRIQAAHYWVLAEEEGEVCGFSYGSPHRERDAYRWAADVAIYVHASCQGRGIGRSLYTQLFDGLRDRGLCVLCAGIALPNPASEALHRSLGFTEIGTYRRIAFKFGQWLDTRWYQLDLRSDRQPPPATVRLPGEPRTEELARRLAPLWSEPH